MNRILRVTVILLEDNTWRVDVLKEFAPEHGGGQAIFSESAPSIHVAMDVARGMVTMSPGTRTGVLAIKGN